jgi:polyhydroxyalkanoate synthase subunit PhaC
MSFETNSPYNSMSTSNLDPFGILSSSQAVLNAWSHHPVEMSARVQDYLQSLAAVQQQFVFRAFGDKPDPVKPSAYDERFQEAAWTEQPWFDFLKEVYLTNTRAVEDAIFATPDVPEKTRRQAAFWTRQWLNALSPSNYLWTNPLALERMIATGGMSLVEGYRQWLNDLAEGEVSIVDKKGYAVGHDIAATPGQVVFRNELLELIQFAPSTAQVRQIPIVIIAPWINKYYVLDLGPQRSLIRYLVSQGFTVFVTSWKNPSGNMANTRFDDYLTQGALPALAVAKEICGVDAVHGVGYCIGGTLLASTLAWSAQDASTPAPVEHWSLFTTLVDFSNPGDIDIFVTEDSVRWIEQLMDQQGGFLDGKMMASSFRWLRPNSLIWRYTVSSYLYGQEPPPMDVLQWNMDATRMPKAMHSFYLRELYLHNKLVQPGAVTLAERPIDLGRITAPLYAIGAEQDHIAPWKETFKIAAQVSGPVHYTLATSGHILGILSPPVDPPKRRYWAGDATGATDPEAWRAGVEKTPGSWWTHWTAWLHGICGPLVEARTPGSKTYPALEAAPGTYVKER